MGNLSKNISRHEIACKCGCGFDTIDIETVEVVQQCCDYFEGVLDRVVLDIHSGSRCQEHNKKVEGIPLSQHLAGRAIDFSIRGASPYDVYDYLVSRYPDKYGIGRYSSFTHLDTRSGSAARWGVTWMQ